MKEFLLTVRGNAPLGLWGLSIVGVPLLMIVFSVALPALRNPVFLVIGAFFGSLLPASWLNGSTHGTSVWTRLYRYKVYRYLPAVIAIGLPVLIVLFVFLRYVLFMLFRLQF